ncbi:MAG: hypothetical protein KCHDKBKB_02028 [Elusimicrobia bacterium]|nr:hypothetical protein [Elusimicrobiota bacterium]
MADRFRLPGDTLEKAEWVNSLLKYGTIRKILKPHPSLSAMSPGTRHTIVHIQDVHLNHEAQKNIGAAICELIDKAQINLLGLEGAFGPLHLTPFQTFPRPESVRTVADFLLRENKIAGPMHTLMTMAPGASLPRVYGVDDRTHYHANVRAVRESGRLKEKIQKEIAKSRQTLEAQKKKIFNQQLLRFDAQVESYRSGKTEIGTYVENLAQQETDLPLTISIFLEGLKLEKSLDFNRVEQQRSQLLDQLLRKLTPEKISELTKAGTAFQTGQWTHGAFYKFLRDLCDTHGLPLSRYKAMESYLQYVLLSDSIDGESLLREAKRLERSIYNRLSTTPAEKSLVRESNRLGLVEKLVDFTLTRDEWEEYKRMDILPNLVQGGGRQRGLTEENQEGFSNIGVFEVFYREAEIRDEKMAKNLLKRILGTEYLDLGNNNEINRGRNPGTKYQVQSTSVVVLVTGGFHSQGIDERLVKAGHTVLTFVPKITQIERGHNSAYLSVFTQQKTPLDKLFAGQKLFLNLPVADKTFWSETAVLISADGLMHGLSFNSVSSWFASTLKGTMNWTLKKVQVSSGKVLLFIATKTRNVQLAVSKINQEYSIELIPPGTWIRTLAWGIPLAVILFFIFPERMLDEKTLYLLPLLGTFSRIYNRFPSNDALEELLKKWGPGYAKRHNMHQQAWQSHLDISREMILAGAEEAPKDSVVILGSSDVKEGVLAPLAEMFNRITLVDIDVDAMKQAVGKLPVPLHSKINMVRWDISGGVLTEVLQRGIEIIEGEENTKSVLAQLGKLLIQFKPYHDPNELRALSASYVISSVLVGQLIWPIFYELETRLRGSSQLSQWTDNDGDPYRKGREHVLRNVFLGHLDLIAQLMKSSSSRAFLSADTVILRKKNDGSIIPIEALPHDYNFRKNVQDSFFVLVDRTWPWYLQGIYDLPNIVTGFLIRPRPNNFPSFFLDIIGEALHIPITDWTPETEKSGFKITRPAHLTDEQKSTLGQFFFPQDPERISKIQGFGVLMHHGTPQFIFADMENSTHGLILRNSHPDKLGDVIFLFQQAWKETLGKNTPLNLFPLISHPNSHNEPYFVFDKVHDDYQVDGKLFRSGIRPRPGADVLDMGSGCGLNGVMARQLGAQEVTAVDIFPREIANTLVNARLHNAGNIKVFLSDLFEQLPQDEKYDNIYFNIPIVRENEKDPDPRLFDPKMVLLERFLEEAKNYLKGNGTIEINYLETPQFFEKVYRHGYRPIVIEGTQDIRTILGINKYHFNLDYSRIILIHPQSPPPDSLVKIWSEIARYYDSIKNLKKRNGSSENVRSLEEWISPRLFQPLSSFDSGLIFKVLSDIDYMIGIRKSLGEVSNFRFDSNYRDHDAVKRAIEAHDPNPPPASLLYNTLVLLGADPDNSWVKAAGTVGFLGEIMGVAALAFLPGVAWLWYALFVMWIVADAVTGALANKVRGSLMLPVRSTLPYGLMVAAYTLAVFLPSFTFPIDILQIIKIISLISAVHYHVWRDAQALWGLDIENHLKWFYRLFARILPLHPISLDWGRAIPLAGNGLSGSVMMSGKNKKDWNKYYRKRLRQADDKGLPNSPPKQAPTQNPHKKITRNTGTRHTTQERMQALKREWMKRKITAELPSDQIFEALVSLFDPIKELSNDNQGIAQLKSIRGIQAIGINQNQWITIVRLLEVIDRIIYSQSAQLAALLAAEPRYEYEINFSRELFPSQEEAIRRSIKSFKICGPVSIELTEQAETGTVQYNPAGTTFIIPNSLVNVETRDRKLAEEFNVPVLNTPVIKELKRLAGTIENPDDLYFAGQVVNALRKFIESDFEDSSMLHQVAVNLADSEKDEWKQVVEKVVENEALQRNVQASKAHRTRDAIITINDGWFLKRNKIMVTMAPYSETDAKKIIESISSGQVQRPIGSFSTIDSKVPLYRLKNMLQNTVIYTSDRWYPVGPIIFPTDVMVTHIPIMDAYRFQDLQQVRTLLEPIFTEAKFSINIFLQLLQWHNRHRQFFGETPEGLNSYIQEWGQGYYIRDCYYNLMHSIVQKDSNDRQFLEIDDIDDYANAFFETQIRSSEGDLLQGMDRRSSVGLLVASAFLIRGYVMNCPTLMVEEWLFKLRHKEMYASIQILGAVFALYLLSKELGLEGPPLSAVVKQELTEQDLEKFAKVISESSDAKIRNACRSLYNKIHRHPIDQIGIEDRFSYLFNHLDATTLKQIQDKIQEEVNQGQTVSQLISSLKTLLPQTEDSKALQKAISVLMSLDRDPNLTQLKSDLLHSRDLPDRFERIMQLLSIGEEEIIATILFSDNPSSDTPSTPNTIRTEGPHPNPPPASLLYNTLVLIGADPDNSWVKAAGTVGFLGEIIGVAALAFLPGVAWHWYALFVMWIVADAVTGALANKVRGSPDWPYMLMVTAYVFAIFLPSLAGGSFSELIPLTQITLFVLAALTHMGRDIEILWGQEIDQFRIQPLLNPMPFAFANGDTILFPSTTSNIFGRVPHMIFSLGKRLNQKLTDQYEPVYEFLNGALVKRTPSPPSEDNTWKDLLRQHEQLVREYERLIKHPEEEDREQSLNRIKGELRKISINLFSKYSKDLHPENASNNLNENQQTIISILGRYGIPPGTKFIQDFNRFYQEVQTSGKWLKLKQVVGNYLGIAMPTGRIQLFEKGQMIRCFNNPNQLIRLQIYWDQKGLLADIWTVESHPRVIRRFRFEKHENIGRFNKAKDLEDMEAEGTRPIPSENIPKPRHLSNGSYSIGETLQITGFSGVDGQRFLRRLVDNGLVSLTPDNRLFQDDLARLIKWASLLQREEYTLQHLATRLDELSPQEKRQGPDAARAQLFFFLRDHPPYIAQSPHFVKNTSLVSRYDALYLLIEKDVLENSGEILHAGAAIAHAGFSGNIKNRDFIRLCQTTSDGRRVWLKRGSEYFVRKQLLDIWCQELIQRSSFNEGSFTIFSQPVRQALAKKYQSPMLDGGPAMKSVGLGAEDARTFAEIFQFTTTDDPIWVNIGGRLFFIQKNLRKWRSELLKRDVPIRLKISEMKKKHTRLIQRFLINNLRGTWVSPYQMKVDLGLLNYSEKDFQEYFSNDNNKHGLWTTRLGVSVYNQKNLKNWVPKIIKETFRLNPTLPYIQHLMLSNIIRKQQSDQAKRGPRLTLPVWRWVFTQPRMAEWAIYFDPSLEKRYGISPQANRRVWAQEFTDSDKFAIHWAPKLELLGMPGLVFLFWPVVGAGEAILISALVISLFHGFPKIFGRSPPQPYQQTFSQFLIRFIGSIIVNSFAFSPFILANILLGPSLSSDALFLVHISLVPLSLNWAIRTHSQWNREWTRLNKRKYRLSSNEGEENIPPPRIHAVAVDLAIHDIKKETDPDILVSHFQKLRDLISESETGRFTNTTNLEEVVPYLNHSDVNVRVAALILMRCVLGRGYLRSKIDAQVVENLKPEEETLSSEALQFLELLTRGDNPLNKSKAQELIRDYSPRQQNLQEKMDAALSRLRMEKTQPWTKLSKREIGKKQKAIQTALVDIWQTLASETPELSLNSEDIDLLIHYLGSPNSSIGFQASMALRSALKISATSASFTIANTLNLLNLLKNQKKTRERAASILQNMFIHAPQAFSSRILLQLFESLLPSSDPTISPSLNRSAQKTTIKILRLMIDNTRSYKDLDQISLINLGSAVKKGNFNTIKMYLSLLINIAFNNDLAPLMTGEILVGALELFPNSRGKNRRGVLTHLGTILLNLKMTVRDIDQLINIIIHLLDYYDESSNKYKNARKRSERQKFQEIRTYAFEFGSILGNALNEHSSSNPEKIIPILNRLSRAEQEVRTPPETETPPPDNGPEGAGPALSSLVHNALLFSFAIAGRVAAWKKGEAFQSRDLRKNNWILVAGLAWVFAEVPLVLWGMSQEMGFVGPINSFLLIFFMADLFLGILAMLVVHGIRGAPRPVVKTLSYDTVVGLAYHLLAPALINPGQAPSLQILIFVLLFSLHFGSDLWRNGFPLSWMFPFVWAKIQQRGVFFWGSLLFGMALSELIQTQALNFWSLMILGTVIIIGKGKESNIFSAVFNLRTFPNRKILIKAGNTRFILSISERSIDSLAENSSYLNVETIGGDHLSTLIRDNLTVKIGRDKSNDIDVENDALMSRNHFEVKIEKEDATGNIKIIIKDLNSRNLTHVEISDRLDTEPDPPTDGPHGPLTPEAPIKEFIQRYSEMEHNVSISNNSPGNTFAAGFKRDTNKPKTPADEIGDTAISDGKLGVVIVGDGVGSTEGGATASKIATAWIYQELKINLTPDIPSRSLTKSIQILNDAVLTANSIILNKQQSEPGHSNMATCLFVGVVCGNKVIIVKIGDVEGYILQVPNMERVINGPESKYVTSQGVVDVMGQYSDRFSLGEGRLFIRKFPAGAELLVVTDGITKVFSPDQIKNIIAPAASISKDTAQSLIEKLLAIVKAAVLVSDDQIKYKVQDDCAGALLRSFENPPPPSDATRNRVQFEAPVGKFLQEDLRAMPLNLGIGSSTQNPEEKDSPSTKNERNYRPIVDKNGWINRRRLFSST